MRCEPRCGGRAARLARAENLPSPHADFAVFRRAHLLDVWGPRRFAQATAAADEPRGRRQRSLAHGIDVRLRNDRGEVILPLEVPPGVVASEKGAWLSTSRTGQTISALVSADLRADLAEGACFNDTQVEVSRA
jgi:hypothetical protein